MDLNELRSGINEIDEQILDLFQKRMKICYQVAEYKIENDLPVFHPEREQQIINRVRSEVPEELGDPVETLFTNMMDISKCMQFQRFFADATPFESKPLDLTGRYKVAVPGTFGSYSHVAADQFLKNGEKMFYESFGEVFAAVESGSADYGVVPVINSTAGTVTQTYELMRLYDFSICACTRVAADHCFAVKQDTDPANVKRVYSHEQALMQCSKYLAEHGYSTRPYENTALAAAFVNDSPEPYGAICSEICAEKLGMKIVDRKINNAKSNFTKFILISKEHKIDDKADVISVSLRLPHQTSALYRLLTKFSVAGLNLTKIESRPIANTDFDVLFYLDFEGSIKSPNVIKLIRELETELKYFKYLGNYREV